MRPKIEAKIICEEVLKKLDDIRFYLEAVEKNLND